MDYVIETQALTKRFGKQVAVNQVSFHVRRGDIYGLIGKNGAGKTTLMRLLLGLAFPNSGEIRIFGGDKQAAQKIGALIEAPGLYLSENAFENMKRFAILTGSSDEEIRNLLALVGLADTGKKTVGKFSLGMKQRLGIAIALLGSPELLILDEPVNGLDPAGIKEIRDLILELHARGVTFLISSHLLDELGKIATTYGIMANGFLVEEITATELAERCKTSLEVHTDNGPQAAELLRQWRPELELSVTENTVHIASEIADTSDVTLVLAGAGVRVYEIRNASVGQEDFFIERMG